MALHRRTGGRSAALSKTVLVAKSRVEVAAPFLLEGCDVSVMVAGAGRAAVAPSVPALSSHLVFTVLSLRAEFLFSVLAMLALSSSRQCFTFSEDPDKP